LIALNTNGSDSKRLARLLTDGLLSRVNLDIKAPVHGYGFLPGLPSVAHEVRSSLSVLLSYSATHPGFEMEFRTTLDRRYISSPADLKNIINMLAELNQRLVIQAARGEDIIGYAIKKEEAMEWLSGVSENNLPEFRGF